MTTRRAPTRKDVAALAGVAPSTVSLVLNGTKSARVSPATRDRIHTAVAHLGYRPHHLARSLVSGRTRTVGVILHFVDMPFSGYVSRVLDGLWSDLQSDGYRFLMGTGSADSALGGLYHERSVDGILVMAVPREAADPELLEAVEARFPLVFVGARPEGLAVESVDLDNRAAGRWATERLLAAGCRRILHISGPTDVNSSAVERLEGYRDALAAAGIAFDPRMVLYGSYSQIVARQALSAAWDAGLRCDGVFAANLGMARAARKVLRERGVRVPETVSITAIDRETSTDGGVDEITTLAQPLREIGRHAAQRLSALIADPTLERQAQLVMGEVVDKGSVAPLG